MSGPVDIRLRVPPLGRLAAKMRRELPLVLAAVMQTQRAMIFDSEGRYNGRPGWAPLKFRVGQILSDSGTLRKSIGPRNDGIVPSKAPNHSVKVEGNVVTIGTTLGYAKMMNDGTANLPGGVLRARAGGVLRIPLPGGKRATPAAKDLHKRSRGAGQAALYVRYVKIPSRPFDDWTTEDTREIAETVEAFIADRIARSGAPQ